MKTALIAGSTGLIGKQLLDLLLVSDRYDKVIAITRRSTEQHHPKLQEIVIHFPQLKESFTNIRADDVFCCLGTTMAKAKTKSAFYEVDYTYPVMLAEAALAHGARQFLMVSALGADKNSSIYYNRVKGEVEEAIGRLGYETCHVFRPSLLLGPRSEKRAGEDAAKTFYSIFGFLIPRRYKAIDSAKVARSMLHFASFDQKGYFVHESSEMQAF